MANINKEKIANSEIAKALARDWPLMQREFEEFEQEWAQFWVKDAAALGKVLTAHLAIEFYLEKFLRAANPSLGDFDSARLSFAQKLELANGTDVYVLKMFYPGIRALSALRNRLAHNIRAQMPDEALSEMALLLRPWLAFWHTPEPTGIDIAVAFALVTCAALNSEANQCVRYGAGKGHGVYAEWMKKSMEGIFDKGT